ncbi:MAG TPA: acetate/propionate family kinase [Thermoleophilaceae bacterium]|nr:acetate/propionate family kinase [Thermoleophilaceae bacterium]
MRVLVVNAGSSSLKLSVLDGESRVSEQELRAERTQIDADEVARAVARLGPVEAVGHRIVHGGPHYREPVRVDAEVVRALTELSALAPLHQAKSLAALEVVGGVLGDVPAVACFDTAFHATLPAAAHTYALPRAWRDRWGLRRYGFHGLAHASAARRAAELLGRPLDGLRLVTCHLGAGASLAAVHDGRSVDTTMGFTPLDGLVMATRSGSIDPGLLLWLLEHTGLGEHEMAHALEHDSGLLALAGEGDMRIVLRAAEQDDPRAILALAVYHHHLRAGIAAMAAAMGGLDALVFCGGVGEHAPAVRAGATDGLGFLGVGIDPHLNGDRDGDRDVTDEGSRVRTIVVAAREDHEVARQVHELLLSSSPGSDGAGDG